MIRINLKDQEGRDASVAVASASPRPSAPASAAVSAAWTSFAIPAPSPHTNTRAFGAAMSAPTSPARSAMRRCTYTFSSVSRENASESSVSVPSAAKDSRSSRYR